MIEVDIKNIKEESGSEEDEVIEETEGPEIDGTFKSAVYLKTGMAVSLNKEYLLHMAAKFGNTDCNIAVSQSDLLCSVYSIDNHFKAISTIPKADDTIVNLRFATDNDNLLYTGSADCKIKLWDLRESGKCVSEFTDKSGKKLTSFDVSCNEKFICGGTGVFDADSFILFWDVRSTKLLGGYWDSHSGDVTQICFHPSVQDTLATGSTDGLINIFDISQPTESEALNQTLNTESSVDKVSWHYIENNQLISCITHTQDLQLWQQDGVSPKRTFTRNELACSLKINEENLYLAGIHHLNDSELMVLAGSVANKKMKCLRSAIVSCKNLRPLTSYNENQQIVRCSCYNQRTGSLITGGEGGLLNLWVPSQTDEEVHSKLKVTNKIKYKNKPY